MDKSEQPVLGIAGAGQLGRMLVQAAGPLGVRCVTLDAEPDAPAAQAGSRHLVGSLFDPAALRRLAESCDIVTFEIEAVDADAMAELERQGHRVRPRPGTLKIIQDKLAQKRLLAAHGIPTSRFQELDGADTDAFIAFGLPAVQKLRRGGYDGRGVQILRQQADLARLLPGPSLVEDFVPAVKELAVLGARSESGEIVCYNVVDMSLGAETNQLEMLKAPADIPDQVAAAALELGRRTIAALDDVGVFAVELFLTASDELLVNEVSPRTHNSGHFTIDACVTSQFEQHIRAVTGMPLGDVAQRRPAAMVNLLGEPGFCGPPELLGESEIAAMADVFIHLYGKRDCRPHRKMGHVTVLGETLDEAVDKARGVQRILRIRGRDPLPAATPSEITEQSNV